MEPGKLGDDTGPIAAPTAAEEEKDDKEQKEKAGKSGTAAADRPTLGRPIYDEPHTSGDDELIESSEEEVQDEEEDEAAVQAAVQRRLERVRQKKKGSLENERIIWMTPMIPFKKMITCLTNPLDQRLSTERWNKKRHKKRDKMMRR